jgi:hypothetical protein
MHFNDSPRNRETEAGPALVPGIRTVDLLKFFEDPFLISRRDARACIPDWARGCIQALGLNRRLGKKALHLSPDCVPVVFMYWDATNTLADRFAWLIDGLCKAIGADAHKRRMEGALAWAIWNRVRVLGARLIALADRARAGRLPVRTGPRPAAGPRAPKSAQAQCTAAASLPRDFGWIRRLLPETAQYAGVLRYLLRDPEVAALVEKAPAAKRILRPLCHLLGVRPLPEFLRRSAGRATAASEVPKVRLGARPSHAAEVPVRPPSLPDSLSPPPEPSPSKGEGEAAGPPIAQEPPLPEPAAVQAATASQPPRPPGGLVWDGRRWIWL